MDRGTWAIWYGIEDKDSSAYMSWFHEVHIPEKLSRPGYLWAAHYALDGENGYLALFGGATAHTFLSPSPAQLAQRQSAETKHFMSMRRQSSTSILAEEIRVDGPETSQRAEDGTTGPVIEFASYDAEGPAAEADVGAWYAQEHLPLLSKLPGCIGARKLLSTVGAQKHAFLQEFVSQESRRRYCDSHDAQVRDPSTWTARIQTQLSHAPRSPAIGTRIWPK